MNLFNVNLFTDNATTAATTQGTLRHAITNAIDGDTIRFAVLPGNIGTSAATITLETPLPEIRRDITIEGNGVTLTRSPSWTASGNSQLLRNFRTITISRVHFKDGLSLGSGGAIYNEESLTLISCIFSGNRTSGSGGAIQNYRNLTVTACTFINNNLSGATSWGGAIYTFTGSNISGTVNLTGNLFYENRAVSSTRGNVVHRSDGNITVISHGYNVYDDAVFVNNPQSGFTVHSSDRSVTGVVLIPRDDFRPHNFSGGVTTFSRPTGYPTVDFFGDDILANGVRAGAVQASSGSNYYIVNNFISDDSSTAGTLRHANSNVPIGGIIALSGVIPGETTITLTTSFTLYRDSTIEGNGITIYSNRHIRKSSGNITIRRVHFKGDKDYRNVAGLSITNSGGLLIFESCIFSDTEGGSGAAIQNSSSSPNNTSGTLIVKGCTFYNNGRGTGSAIFNYNITEESLILAGNLFYQNLGGTVFSNSVVKSLGYNVTDAASASWGFPGATGDVFFIGSAPNLGISGVPINTTTFRPVTTGRLHNHIPAPAAGNSFWARDNMPPVDFYGDERTWPGAAGAVR